MTLQQVCYCGPGGQEIDELLHGQWAGSPQQPHSSSGTQRVNAGS